MSWWESWTFGLLHASGFCGVLAMVIEIVDYHSGAKDCCDGVVT
jgi:predicted outer membrane lipoprotein